MHSPASCRASDAVAYAIGVALVCCVPLAQAQDHQAAASLSPQFAAHLLFDTVLFILIAIAFAAVLGLPVAIRRFRSILHQASRYRASEERFLTTAESGLDAIFILQAIRSKHGVVTDFRYTFVNRNAAVLSNLEPEQLIGRNVYEVYPHLRFNGRFEAYLRVMQTGEPFIDEGTYSVLYHHGVPAQIRLHAVKLADGIALTITDITARTQVEKDLQSALSFNSAVIACSSFCMIVTNTAGVITSINPAAERMLGYTANDLLGRNWTLLHDSLEIEQRAHQLTAELGAEVSPGHPVLQALAQRGLTDEREWTYLLPDGSRLPVQLSVSPLKNPQSEAIIGFIGIAYDLTERKQTEERIHYVAHHDPLTHLPTRALLRDRLEVAIERAERIQSSLAVLVVDLDNYKRVNDSLGHQAGDTLLCEIAARLKSCIRKSDTVARMGGDEFVVLLAEMHSPGDAQDVAAKLLSAIAQPVLIGRHDIRITASIGIGIFPDTDDLDMLLKNADLAMYRVKARGRNGIEVYKPGLNIESYQKLQMESALRGAIEANELEIVYQPQVSFADDRMIGVEALLRWNSAEFGTVMPTTFIPLAEETGLIVPIGEWILRMACQQIAALQVELKREIDLAINISPRQFQQKNFPHTIERALQDSGLRAQQLELEITEQLLMIDSEESLEIMQRVRKLGVRFAIDDFGTGFSNMGYITRFAVDRIKIDRSFISKCDTDSNGRAVTSAIIALAHSLDIEVIAEGVETSRHVETLKLMQCDHAQGYLYSRPLQLGALRSFATKAFVLEPISHEKSGIRRAFLKLHNNQDDTLTV